MPDLETGLTLPFENGRQAKHLIGGEQTGLCIPSVRAMQVNPVRYIILATHNRYVRSVLEGW